MRKMARIGEAKSGVEPMSAEELRKEILREQVAEADKRLAARREEERQHIAFAEDFLRHHIGAEELAMVQRLIMEAVHQGKFEALVYSFPSSLCTDSGRAINSSDPDWPETLQGKAREFYEKYATYARPRGYHLSAMIVNFPDGIPGDVGFFLSWAPSL